MSYTKYLTCPENPVIPIAETVCVEIRAELEGCLDVLVPVKITDCFTLR
jgi:hypothetical protein